MASFARPFKARGLGPNTDDSNSSADVGCDDSDESNVLDGGWADGGVAPGLAESSSLHRCLALASVASNLSLTKAHIGCPG